MGTEKVNPSAIVLEWACNNDDEHEGADDQVLAYQDLTDVPEVGTPVCDQCDRDMELVGVELTR